MKETRYRFTINGKTYTGYGYASTRCSAILSESDQGFGYEVTKVEAWSDKSNCWKKIKNRAI